MNSIREKKSGHLKMGRRRDRDGHTINGLFHLKKGSELMRFKRICDFFSLMGIGVIKPGKLNPRHFDQMLDVMLSQMSDTDHTDSHLPETPTMEIFSLLAHSIN